MSRQKKPRNKKYSPTKSKDMWFRRKAERCILYRWTSMEGPEGGYVPHGPYSPAENEELMTWALNRTDRWLCTVVASYLTESEDYYEEEYNLPILGPLVMGKFPDSFYDLLGQVVQEARTAGNPKHYIDTSITLALYSEQLELKLEDDDWVKDQARRRAIMLRQKQKEKSHASTNA